jgi:CheY-specific phosphatase CheX
MTAFEPVHYQQEISRIVDDVLTTMFTDRAVPLTGGRLPASASYTASVGFAGDWKGAVLLKAEVRTAENLARELLQAQEVSPADVSDAMGEFANMIGGNLKSVLPGVVSLSVPCVVKGDQEVRIHRGTETEVSRFVCAAGLFEVVLIRVFEDIPSSRPTRVV